MSENNVVQHEEFNRVLEGISRAEARMTERIDGGFDKINGRVRAVEERSVVMDSRLGLVERVMFAGVGLALTAIVLAILDMVVRRGN